MSEISKRKRLIISVKEARKLLGMTSANMTDEEIEILITGYEQIATVAIKGHMVNKYNVINS